MIIRPEEEEIDHAAVRRLHLNSFETSAEADLVEHLRRDGNAVISLVAVEGDDVIGHAMFSEMSAPFQALGLAPVAVLAGWRRQGIASKLIEKGIELATGGPWQAVFVLGDTSFYGRFGFSAEAARRFEAPFAGPYFMVRPLSASGLPSRSGRVEYAPAFSRL